MNTSIANVSATSTIGRPVTVRTKKIRQGIISYLRRNRNEELTTNAIAKCVKVSKQKVVAQLRRLEKDGIVAKVGSAKVTQGKGRPSAVWTATEGTHINETKRSYVKKMRAYVRAMAAMSYEERKEFVHTNLKALNERQVDEEQEVKESIYLNAMGFTAYDAKRGMRDAEKEDLTMGDVNYWLAGRRLYKYAKQLSI